MNEGSSSILREHVRKTVKGSVLQLINKKACNNEMQFEKKLIIIWTFSFWQLLLLKLQSWRKEVFLILPQSRIYQDFLVLRQNFPNKRQLFTLFLQRPIATSCLNMRSLHCVIALVCSNHGNYCENETICGEGMLIWFVAFWLMNTYNKYELKFI